MAAAYGVHEVLLRPDSTRTAYMLQFLNKVFVGMSDAGAATNTLTVVRTEASSTD